MNASEEHQITQWYEGLTQEVNLRLKKTADKRTDLLLKFCEHLARVGPGIRFTQEKEADETSVPAIEILPNLLYQAVPSGRELGPFLDALALKKGRISDTVKNHLEKLKVPVFLSLYISPECPFCPKMAADMVSLASAQELIRLTIIDAGLFADLAEVNDIRAVPTLIMDDHQRWTGIVKPEEVAAMAVDHDPSHLGASSVEQIIKDGKAGVLAQMMLDKRQIFEAFLDVLTHKEWTIRLGAMVAVETLADEDRKLAAQIIPFLQKGFDHFSDGVRGDALYIMGLAGDKDTAAWIQKILNGDCSSEIRDAGQEALENIAENIGKV
jgi:thiol-disulfide isomerase/thioredoxin